MFLFIFYSDIPAPECWTGIWLWWITISFGYTMLSVLPLPSILFGVSIIYSGIVNVNETGIPYDLFCASLSLFGTIISMMNFYSRIPLTNLLLSVSISSLIFLKNVHIKMLLYTSMYSRTKYTVIGFVFTMK